MRNETIVFMFLLTISALLGFNQVPIVSATSSTPNVFEILAKGDITFIGAGSTTKMIVIGAESFIPQLSGAGYTIEPDGDLFQFFSVRILAPVDLPDGATITELECKVRSSFGGDTDCKLIQSPYGSFNPSITVISSLTSGSGGGFETLTSSTLNHLVDRDLNRYYIIMDPLSSPPCSNCIVIAVKITYTVPSSGITVGGEFIPVDNVSLVLAYSLVNSWWMAPIGIGIGLGIYLVKRKL